MSTSSVNELPFEPLPTQRDFLLSTADQVMLSGSFGAGKSRIGCEKGYFLNMRYPGNRGLIIRKSLKDVKTSTVNQTLLPEVIPRSHIPESVEVGGEKMKGHTKRENIIRHYTGEYDENGDPVLSEIYYYGVEGGRSARDDDLPEKIGSTAFGWIFVDEGTELERGEWNQLYGRLRYKGKRQAGNLYSVPFRQIFTATNPDSPNHWMYEHFRPEAPEEGKGDVFKMNLFDNPHLPDQYVKNLEENLSGMYYERYVKGNWVGAEGIVYNEYDPAKHLCEPDELPRAEQWQVHGEEEYGEGEKSVYVTPPPDWRIYRTIDFGYRNPFVCQWWAESPEGYLVLFREVYETEKLVEDMAPRIDALTPDGRGVDMTVCDHDADEYERLRRYGVDTTPAKKGVEVGIQSVKSRLKNNAEGEPELYFLMNARAHEPDIQLKLEDKPLSTVDEIYGYKWADDDEEEPEKEGDHGMDAMRYLVHTRDGGPILSTEEMEEYEDLFNSGDW